MGVIRLSLTYRLFAAISLAALLVVCVMALLVGHGMREGFSLYLLKGELRRLDGLADQLAADHDILAGGWPELDGNSRLWADYVARLAAPEGRGVPAPPPHAPRPPAPFGERLSLLDARGDRIVGEAPRGAPAERLPIPAEGAADGDPPLGWLELAAPAGALTETDAFFLRGQIASLLLSASVALAVSALAAYVVARQFLAPTPGRWARCTTRWGG